MKKIYEVRDASCDETYYTLGVFPDLETPLTALLNADTDEPFSEYQQDNDSETIIIVERGFGWNGAEKEVVRLSRDYEYNESLDNSVWTVTEKCMHPDIADRIARNEALHS